MAAGDIETFTRDGIWFNRIEGEPHTIGPSFGSREQAVKVGRGAAAARQVEHTVRDAGGLSGDTGAYDLHPRELIRR